MQNLKRRVQELQQREERRIRNYERQRREDERQRQGAARKLRRELEAERREQYNAAYMIIAQLQRELGEARSWLRDEMDRQEREIEKLDSVRRKEQPEEECQEHPVSRTDDIAQLQRDIGDALGREGTLLQAKNSQNRDMGKMGSLLKEGQRCLADAIYLGKKMMRVCSGASQLREEMNAQREASAEMERMLGKEMEEQRERFEAEMGAERQVWEATQTNLLQRLASLESLPPPDTATGAMDTVVRLTSLVDKLEADIEETRTRLRESQEQVAEYQGQLEYAQRIARSCEELMVRNDQLREQLFECRGTFRTVVRIQGPPPPRATDEQEGYYSVEDTDAGIQGVTVKMPRQSSLSSTAIESRRFAVDRVLLPEDDESKVYAKFETLFDSARDGSQAVTVAYGRSGMGKTHTLQSLLRHVGDRIFPPTDEDDPDVPAPARLSYTELYPTKSGEELMDLAASPPRRLSEIPPVSSRSLLDPTAVSQQVPIRSAGDLVQILEKREARQRTAATRANASSSRSHAFVSLMLTGSGGRITFVDLAGHERSDKSGSNEEEARWINTGLSDLRTALNDVARRQTARKKRPGGVTATDQAPWLAGKSRLAPSLMPFSRISFNIIGS